MVIGVVAFLEAWAARAGVEVIGRAGQVIFPLLAGSVVLIFLLLLRDIDFSALWPPDLVRFGPVPLLKSTFDAIARSIEFIWLGMMVPYVNERRGLLRAAVLSVVWDWVTWTLITLAVAGTMVQFADLLNFPFFTATRLVSIADFLERIDALLLGVWLFGMFLRGSLLLWAAALGTAQWLGLKAYRPLVAPLTCVAVTYSIAQAENFSELRGYLKPETFTPFGLTFLVFLPVLVLLIAAVRRMHGSGRYAARRRS